MTLTTGRTLISLNSTNRRTFLTNCAAAGVFAMSGVGPWTGSAWAQAATVDGVPQGIVSNTFGSLAGALLAAGEWNPYPRAGEQRWSAVPQQVRESIIARADVGNSSPWPEMLATDELEFKRNGNRTRFETITFGRRNRLGNLVLAECIANTGKYLDEIANGVWLICEESFWGVPAHLGAQKKGVGLTDEAEPIIELFGAETAATVGWVAYLLGTQLDTVSPRIVERIHMETRRRILDPYFERNDFSWMGLNRTHTMGLADSSHRLNNWNPWINSNILTANLLLEKIRCGDKP